MDAEYYEIYLNGQLLDKLSLAGIAFLKYQSARLLGCAVLKKIRVNPCPVLAAQWVYDESIGGWV